MVINMNRLRTPFAWMLTSVLAAALAGCGKSETPVSPPYVMPEVNDATCAKSSIEAMPVTDAERRDFGSKCARRGSYSPSPKKTW